MPRFLRSPSTALRPSWVKTHDDQPVCIPMSAAPLIHLLSAAVFQTRGPTSATTPITDTIFVGLLDSFNCELFLVFSVQLELGWLLFNL